ncbi:MAG: DNA-binding response regulator [Chthoniobacteraceae bacterium]|nr:DNA-binding response regulator [Chthoniobacteraceae bacterium]
MTGSPTRILLIDDHEVVRRGLRSMIEAHGELEVCGEAADGRAGVQLAFALQPDIVIMDIGMPELNGLEATRKVLECSPKSEVLVLSMHYSEQFVRDVIIAGARGYVVKSDAALDLVDALEALRNRTPFFSKCILKMIDPAVLRDLSLFGQPAKPSNGLTPREREIMQLLAEGKSNKAVGRLLGISVKTAETHRARIMKKLKMDSVADLVRYAIRNQVIQA